MLQFKKIPDIPIATREEHQGSHHHSTGAQLSHPQLEMTVPLPASLSKDYCHSCCISGGGTINKKVERKTRGHATIPEDPQISHFTPEEQDFPALPQLSPQVSNHNMVARETALCDNLEGKPQIPVSTLHRKPETAATAWKESSHACLHSRRGLTPLWRLQRNPKIHVRTGEETSGSDINSR